MEILFITHTRIGDAVLSTGLLDHIAHKYPDAKVTIACGFLSAPLFEGYPNLRKIIPLKKQKFNGHWMKLWKQTVNTRWDMVIDLRNSIVSRLVPAGERYIYTKRINPQLHKVEQAAAVMRLDYAPAPKLWFSNAQKRKAADFIPDGEVVLGVGPAANWQGKIWPAKKFEEIIRFMTAPDGPMPNAKVAVFAAAGEEKIANQVLQSVEEGRRIDVIARADPGVAAAIISRCAFYIGNDSGLTHCAAASGAPTLALFGPSYPHLYRPWGPHCDYAQTPETYDELTAYEGYTPASAPCLMKSLSVDVVKDKIRKMLG